MHYAIELKHVGPKRHVRQLLEELLARLDQQLQRYPDDAVTVRVYFEENAAHHKLYRASITCHVPGRMLAAHEESHDAGTTIRAAFEEIERQFGRQKLRGRRASKRAIQRLKQTVPGRRLP